MPRITPCLWFDGCAECGWLKDRFGVSWQVVPREVGAYLAGPDADGNRRAMEAMLAMGKLDIDTIRRACEGPVD
jgi:predicted 3-demethylubiquinone-9 3-methyltransferase (glyoxalase superfamily)